VKKILTLFQRNYESDKLVRDEVTPGAGWVKAVYSAMMLSSLSAMKVSHLSAWDQYHAGGLASRQATGGRLLRMDQVHVIRHQVSVEG
jgi:hypothetical protein